MPHIVNFCYCKNVQVERMVAFSVLTPYYDEDVMFSTKQLKQENEDGVSILYYLQKIYPGIINCASSFINHF
jgi:hypothetical protein